MNTEYQYGRGWNVHTPRAAIEQWVNGLHVSVSDDEITDEIEARVARARKFEPRWNKVIERQSVAFALLVHARNRDLYLRVMTGNLRP